MFMVSRFLPVEYVVEMARLSLIIVKDVEAMVEYNLSGQSIWSSRLVLLMEPQCDCVGKVTLIVKGVRTKMKYLFRSFVFFGYACGYLKLGSGWMLISRI